MPLIVKKFGGTSLSNIDKIKNAVKIVAAEIECGNQVIVIASAMAGVTDELVYLSKSISNLETIEQQKEYDAIIATGEKISSGLFALALQEIGLKARSWQGWQIPIYTDGIHTNSKITHINTKIIHEALAAGEVPVITGFQGLYQGRITTLGRGGSDTTATAIAAAMKANRCDIYTDVDGVYTADPNVLPDATRITRLDFKEMLELADAGAKVLHPRSVEIAASHNLDLRVLSTFNPESPGTTVEAKVAHKRIEMATITAIAHNKNISCIMVEVTELTPAVLKELYEIANVAGAVSNVQQLDKKILFTLPKGQDSNVLKILTNKGFNAKAIAQIEQISIVGTGIKTDTRVLQEVLKILVAYQVQLVAFTISAVRLSVMVDRADNKLLQDLHNIFGLNTIAA